MNFIKQINAFFMQNLGTLNPNERAFYLGLLELANLSNWTEWFEASNERTKPFTGVTRNETIAKIRNHLKELGLIDYENGNKKTPTRYKIIQLYDEATGSVANHKANQSTEMKFASEPQSEPQNNATGSVANHKANHKANHLYKQNINIDRDRETRARAYTREEKTEDPEYEKVKTAFMLDVGQLLEGPDEEDFKWAYEHYGKDMMLRAIREGKRHKARRLAYIMAILDSWERNGEPQTRGVEKHGHSSNTGKAQANPYEAYDRAMAGSDPWDVQSDGGAEAG